MSREAITATAAPPPVGTYSQAIKAAGTLVFISGQTPRSRDGLRLKDAPFPQQARMTMDNLAAIAGAAGLSLQDAIKVDVFLRDLADREAFDAIYAEYVGNPPPARTLTQSNFTEFDVEVSAVLVERELE
jgi:2-iminobutanoate/2-iminopropanoate deaminase